MNKIRKVINFQVKQVGDPEDRVLRFIGSTENIDRAEDIIRVSGWQLDNYLKNPVFLWCHDYGCPPVGKAVTVLKDETNKLLIFDIKFPTVSELSSDPNNASEWSLFVDTVYNLYKGGYMAGVSVGFIPLKSKMRDDDAALEKPEWMRGREFVEQELLELSAVPVPCNPEALQTAKSAGLDGRTLDKVFSFRPPSKNVRIYFADDEQSKKLLDAARKFLGERGLEPTSIIVNGKKEQVLAKFGEQSNIAMSFDFLKAQADDEDDENLGCDDDEGKELDDDEDDENLGCDDDEGKDLDEDEEDEEKDLDDDEDEKLDDEDDDDEDKELNDDEDDKKLDDDEDNEKELDDDEDEEENLDDEDDEKSKKAIAIVLNVASLAGIDKAELASKIARAIKPAAKGDKPPADADLIELIVDEVAIELEDPAHGKIELDVEPSTLSQAVAAAVNKALTDAIRGK